MKHSHTHYCADAETVTIAADVHQLSYPRIELIVFRWDPETRRHRLTSGLIATCTYAPPDFTLTVTFTRPFTGYFSMHEHPEVQFARRVGPP